jgi:hypothetical protein
MSDCMKIRYWSRARARAACRRMRAIGDTGRLNAYRCSWCGWWHIGHGDAGLVKRMRRFHRYNEGGAA